MKTLKELERERAKKENAKISNLLNSYKRDDISIATKNFIIKKLNRSKKAVGNISDVVRQEIAKHANLLFEGLRDSLTQKDFRRLYYADFGEFIEKVSSLEETAYGYEKLSDVAYNENVQKAILYFGLTKAELEFLFVNGLSDASRDIIMAFINKRYKTQIPMLNELLEQAKNEKNEIKREYLCKKLKLNNGEFLESEYPTYYEFEIDNYYKEKLKEPKGIIRRILK